jgi:hypothetical protein
MPTSLVSTGVQFPDSTIQTTAATGSPNYNQLGTTIIWAASNSVSFPIGITGAVGMRWASSNILTTRPTQIATPPVEMVLHMNANSVSTFSSTSGNFVAATSGAGSALSNTLDYGAVPKLVKDGFTGRYLLAPAQLNWGSYSSSAVYYSTGWTSDFINWQGLDNGSVSTSAQISAFNHYTGTRIYLNPPNTTTQFFRAVANIAYNQTASPTNTFDTSSITGAGVGLRNVGFLDTGTQGTSRLYVLTRPQSGISYFIYSTDDGVNWSSVAISTGNDAGRIVGSTAEIMFYAFNNGIRRSTNLGNSWGSYDFGDNVQGTQSNFHPASIAWNGTTWLAVTDYNSRLVTKAMGSSTSWTRLTNTGAFANPSGFHSVAYNPTLSAWLAIDSGGRLYSNTNSDPNAGSWTLRAQVANDNPFGQAIRWNLSVVAANTFNFY